MAKLEPVIFAVSLNQNEEEFDNGDYASLCGKI